MDFRKLCIIVAVVCFAIALLVLVAIEARNTSDVVQGFTLAGLLAFALGHVPE